MKIIIKENNGALIEIDVTLEEILSIIDGTNKKSVEKKSGKKLFIIKFNIDSDMDFGIMVDEESDCNEFGWVDIIEIEANDREEAFEILRNKFLNMICNPTHDFGLESINRMFDIEKENFIKNGEFNLHGNWDDSYFKIIKEIDI